VAHRPGGRRPRSQRLIGWFGARRTAPVAGPRPREDAARQLLLSRDLTSAGEPDVHRMRVPHPHESDTPIDVVAEALRASPSAWLRHWHVGASADTQSVGCGGILSPGLMGVRADPRGVSSPDVHLAPRAPTSAVSRDKRTAGRDSRHRSDLQGDRRRAPPAVPGSCNTIHD
jgi:hypothetical protein